jgi:HEPN domain-containing protein
MPEGEKVLAVCREWVSKAENDLTNAAHALKLEEDCPTDTVCFHAQQCVEKYVKALLVVEAADFPKTHDLGTLIALLSAAKRPQLTPEEQGLLTEYATGARYPGWGDITLGEARKAVAIARRVRRQIRHLLPREVLRRRKP